MLADMARNHLFFIRDPRFDGDARVIRRNLYAARLVSVTIQIDPKIAQALADGRADLWRIGPDATRENDAVS